MNGGAEHPEKHRGEAIQFPQRRPGIRCSVRAAFLFLAVVLLTLAFALPQLQWLAWFALAPWLAAVASAPTLKSALAWAWLGAVLFFGANLWWLWTATIPGTVLTVLYFSLFWAAAGAAVRFVGIRSTLTVAAIWAAFEWLRGVASGGFPWLLIGHSQARFPLVCQAADAAGVFGVTFCVVAVNALLAAWMIDRRTDRAAVVRVAGVVAIALLYGALRLSQRAPLAPGGPRVMVVQSNFPFGRGGVRTATREASAEFHLTATADALSRERGGDGGGGDGVVGGGGGAVDLIVWSEAVMPPLNQQARDELRRAPVASFLESTHRRIGELAASRGAAIVTGGYFVGGWTGPASARTGGDIRNSAFLYHADGRQSPLRYDKIELVPFAERMPLAWAPSRMRNALLWLAAPSARQPDTAGDPAALTVFTIPQGRFVTPICFENVDARFVSNMIRPPDGSRGKRADFLVNLTNDGWFASMEHEHHFRCATTFRAIENRVPIARASNTGISGFVDSCGRTISTLPVGVDGTLTATLLLDRRTTFYQRFGDVFAVVCALWTVAAIVIRSTRGGKMV